MDVTLESEEQTRDRLLLVLAAAEVRWLAGEYSFKEVHAPEQVLGDLTEALAIVRDDAQWSILKRAETGDPEKFYIFSCHFSAGIPNSGFVGWLASEFKRRLGTGVFVVCGQNSERGGIFDYWGVPAEISGQAKQFLASRLRTDISGVKADVHKSS